MGSSDGVISVSCDDFITQSKSNCIWGDYLYISDGTGSDLGTYCGTKGPDVTSSDNYMSLSFNANNDNTRKTGFSCTAECSVPTTPPTTVTMTSTDLPSTVSGWSGACDSTLTASDGMSETWESPNYDGISSYPYGEYCCWMNITIPDTYSMFMVTMEMSSSSGIHETSE